MQRSVLFFGLTSVVTLCGAVAACSSTTTVTDLGGGDAGVAETSPPRDSASSAQDSSDLDTGSSGDPDMACGALATQSACGNCCNKNHMAGATVLQNAVADCACKGTGIDGGAPCLADCMDTFCAATPAAPSMACVTCIQASVAQGGACQMSASDACMPNADCLAGQQCIKQCIGKPTM